METYPHKEATMRDNPTTRPRASCGLFPRLSLLSLAAVLVGTFALVGCGGGGGGNDGTAEPTTTAAADATDETTAEDETTTDDGPEPMTAAERRWMNQFNRYSARVERVLFSGDGRVVTQASIRREIAVLADCRRTLRRAGASGRFGTAERRLRGACEKFEKARRALERVLAADGPSVVVGTPEDQIVTQAIETSSEAEGNGYNALMSARDQVKSIRADIPE